MGFYPAATDKYSLILLKMNSESCNAPRRRAPRRSPPIDALPQHRELGRRQSNDTVGGRRPGEATALQDLVIQTKTLLVPIQKFHPVALLPTESEDRARAGILPEHLLGCGSKALDSFPHIRDAAGDIDPNPGARTNHAGLHRSDQALDLMARQR